MQHRQEIARSAGNDATPRAKHGGFPRKMGGFSSKAGDFARKVPSIFGFAATLWRFPSRSPPAHRSKKARPSMNFTKGARPTADFGRFGRKNTDSTAGSLLFLTVSPNITANNRYFCNIFYPLMAQVHIAFCPVWAADGAARPQFNPTNENSTSPIGAFVLRHGTLVRYAYCTGAKPRTTPCRTPHLAQSDDDFGATHGTAARQLAPRSRQFGGSATRNAATQRRRR